MAKVTLDGRVDANEEDQQAEVPKPALLHIAQLAAQTALQKAPGGHGANNIGQHPNKRTYIDLCARAVDCVERELKLGIDANAIGPADGCQQASDCHKSRPLRTSKNKASIKHTTI